MREHAIRVRGCGAGEERNPAHSENAPAAGLAAFCLRRAKRRGSVGAPKGDVR